MNLQKKNKYVPVESPDIFLEIPGFIPNGVVLPTGQILVAAETSFYFYSPGGPVDPKLKPVIEDVPDFVYAGQTYKISGRKFNGASQASMYGDDYQAATNYPLVRLIKKPNPKSKKVNWSHIAKHMIILGWEFNQIEKFTHILMFHLIWK